MSDKILSKKIKLIRLTTHPMSLRFLLTDQLFFLNKYLDVLGVASEGEDLKKVSELEKVRTHSVNMERNISLIRDVIALIKLIILFFNEKPVLIHSNTPKSSLLSMISGWITRVPIRIYSVTGLRFESSTGLMKFVLIQIEKLTCFFATTIIAEGNGVKTVIENYKITSKRVEILGYGSINGVDIHRFSRTSLVEKKIEHIKQTIKYSKSNTYLIFVGRLVKDKGLSELIEAFKLISAKKKDLKLILLGTFEHDLDPLPSSIINEININNNILQVGFSLDVEYYMSLADYFVFPSHREGLPNVLLQAGALGCPILCSNILANLDIVHDKKTGIIFDAKNSKDLYEKLIWALDNKYIMLNYANILRENIQTRFERGYVHKVLLDKYKELLDLL